jgi:glycosyltransferase involved in cell wall biosynthesis
MIIGIDGKPLVQNASNGLTVYAWNFIHAIESVDTKNTYILFLPKPIQYSFKKNFRMVVGPAIPWQFAFPLVARKNHVDIMHILQQHGSMLFHYPRTVVTFHDLADSSAYPSLAKNIYYGILRYYVPFIRKHILKNSAALVVDTHAIKKEIQSKTIYTNPVYVIPLAADSVFKSHEYKHKRYILALSDFSPRKNTLRTVRAYKNLPIEIQKKYPLYIIVSTDAKSNVEKIVDTLDLRNHVKIFQHVSKQNLASFYQKAMLFLYPSLYEGFGLPILEAMQSGCPVLTSNYGAMKEVAGNAACLVDPKSTIHITEGIKKIITNQKYRNKLILKGSSHVKKFSWEKAARETIRVYEKVYKQHI